MTTAKSPRKRARPLRSNFLSNLGYGDAGVLFPRSPRFSFDEIVRII